MGNIILFTKDSHPKGGFLDSVEKDFDEVFSMVTDLSKRNVSFLEYCDVVKKVCDKISIINRCDRKFNSYEKICFEPEILESLCFYSYVNDNGIRVKVPMFLTDLFEHTRKFIDFSGIDWTNVCLSADEDDFPEDLKKYFEPKLKSLSYACTTNQNDEPSFIFNFRDLNISGLNFDVLHYGTTKRICCCNFSGYDLSTSNTKALDDVFVYYCNFEKSGLTIEKIQHLCNAFFKTSLRDKWNMKVPEHNFNKLTGNDFQNDSISLSLLCKICDTNDYREPNFLKDSGVNITFTKEDLPVDFESVIVYDEEIQLAYDIFNKSMEEETNEKTKLKLFLNIILRYMKWGYLSGCYINGIEIPNDEVSKDEYKDLFAQSFPMLSSDFIDYLILDNCQPNRRLKRLGLDKFKAEYQTLLEKIVSIIPLENLDVFLESILFPSAVEYIRMNDDERLNFKNWVEYIVEFYDVGKISNCPNWSEFKRMRK